MGKVAKARKSTHATKKATAKTRGKIIEDPNAEWDVESVGKLNLLFRSNLSHKQCLFLLLRTLLPSLRQEESPIGQG